MRPLQLLVRRRREALRFVWKRPITADNLIELITNLYPWRFRVNHIVLGYEHTWVYVQSTETKPKDRGIAYLTFVDRRTAAGGKEAMRSWTGFPTGE